LEPASVDLAGIGSVSWGKELRKLTNFSDGYIAGAGDAVLCRLVLDSVQKPNRHLTIDAMSSVVASTANRIRTPLLENLQGAAALFDRTTFVASFANSGRPLICSISSSGDISNRGQSYVAAWPPDVEQATISERLEKFENEAIAADRPDLNRITTSLCALASDMHSRSRTVGGYVDIGITIVDKRVAHMGHVSGRASELAQKPGQELAQLTVHHGSVPF